MVVGAPVECDCGGGIRYLKSGVKRDEVGAAKIMLNADVKDSNFTGRFDSCSAAYAPESKECLRSPLPLWFGAEETVSFGSASAKSFMKDYYDNIQRCQNILTSLFDGSSSPYTGKPLTDFLLAAQRNYVENHRSKGASGFCGDIYRNPHMKNYNDAVGDLNAYQTSIDRIAKNIGISKPFRKPEPMNFSSVPSELPSLQDTLLLELENLLYEAQTHLDAAQGILNGFQSDSFGSPLIDTSVLVCTQGGVISIVDDGQKDSEGNYLHGFSEDLQHIWYGGYKYKVYVPEQPQTKTYDEIVKGWTKVNHETTKHASLKIYENIFYSGLHNKYQMIPTSIDEGSYNFTFPAIGGNFPEHPYDGSRVSELHIDGYNIYERFDASKPFRMEDHKVADGVQFWANGIKKTHYNDVLDIKLQAGEAYPAGSWQATAKVGMSLLPHVIDAFEKNIIILEIMLDFYITDGEHIVTIRWNDYQMLKKLQKKVGGIYSMAMHDNTQKRIALQKGIEGLLKKNGFIEAPPYGSDSQSISHGVVGIGPIPSAKEKMEKKLEEREVFIKEHPDAGILPDFKSSNSPAYSGSYDFLITLSKKRKNTNELGYLYYNKKSQLMSQEVIYDDDDITLGWSKEPQGYTKYHRLIDAKTLLFPTEPYYIYHYLLYNWVNGFETIKHDALQEDAANKDEWMQPNLANNKS